MDLEEGEEGELNAVHHLATSNTPQKASAPELHPVNRRTDGAQRAQQPLLQGIVATNNLSSTGSQASASRFDKRALDRAPDMRHDSQANYTDRRAPLAGRTSSTAAFVDVRDVHRRSSDGVSTGNSTRTSGLLGAGPLDERRGMGAPPLTGMQPASILGPAAAALATPTAAPLLQAKPASSRPETERRSRFEERPGPRPLLPHTPGTQSIQAPATPLVQAQDDSRHMTVRSTATAKPDIVRNTPALQPAPKGLLPVPAAAVSTPVVQPSWPPQASSAEGRMFLASHAVGVSEAQVEAALEIAELKSRSLARIQLLFSS